MHSARWAESMREEGVRVTTTPSRPLLSPPLPLPSSSPRSAPPRSSPPPLQAEGSVGPTIFEKLHRAAAFMYEVVCAFVIQVRADAAALASHSSQMTPSAIHAL